jgi:hypothetical protein
MPAREPLGLLGFDLETFLGFGASVWLSALTRDSDLRWMED